VYVEVFEPAADRANERAMESYLELAMAAIEAKAAAAAEEADDGAVGSDDGSDDGSSSDDSDTGGAGRFALRRDWGLDDGTADAPKYLDLSGVGKKRGDGDNQKLLPGRAAVSGIVALAGEAQERMASSSTIARQQAREGGAAAQRSADRDWFAMRTPKITPEVEHDLDVLHMRRYLDPKSFYKGSHNDRKVRDNFEVGTIVAGKGEYFSARIPRRERKQRLVDELLADQTFRGYAKRKFGELQSGSGAGRQFKGDGKSGKKRGHGKKGGANAKKRR
jgi:hypothetical protein